MEFKPISVSKEAFEEPFNCMEYLEHYYKHVIEDNRMRRLKDYEEKLINKALTFSGQ